MTGAKLNAPASYGQGATIDFTEANLANASLRGAERNAVYYGDIDFTDANLIGADLSDWKLNAGQNDIVGLPPLFPPPPPSPASSPPKLKPASHSSNRFAFGGYTV